MRNRFGPAEEKLKKIVSLCSLASVREHFLWCLLNKFGEVK